MTQTVVHVPASEGGGAFDPTDITITDNTSGAFLIKEGSNEYMRINTTDGSEQVTINNPAVSDQFLRLRKVSATSDYVQLKNGAYSQVYMNRAGGNYTTEVTGTKVLNKLVSPSFTGRYQIMANTGSVLIQEVDTDHNFTHTLADTSAAVFKVENPNESYDYLNINEANNRTTIQTGSDTSDYIILKAGGYEALQIQGTTNVTFTLNNGNSANFKVKAGGHDYIDVETASGSEFIELKGRPGNNSKLVMNNDPYLQGSANQSTQMASFGVQTAVSNSGHRIINKLGHSTNYFQVSDSGNAAILKVEEDSSATFTLDTANNGVFKVEDNLGSPTQFLTIDSNTSSESIKLSLTPANADRFFEMTSSKIHARCHNSQIEMGVGKIDFVGYDNFAFKQYTANKKLQFLDAQTAEERFSVDKESNATFTLDSTSGASFKIKDNASTPRTFLDIDEGNTTAEIKIGGDGSETAGSTFTLFTGGTAPHYQVASAKIQNGGATTGTVDVDFQNAPHCTIYVGPTASGQTFTFNIKDGASGNNRSYMELPLRVINEGSAACTIKGQSANGTYSTIDHVGSSALDSSGFSLAEGDTAFFRIVKANKARATNTTANNVYVCETLAVA